MKKLEIDSCGVNLINTLDLYQINGGSAAVQTHPDHAIAYAQMVRAVIHNVGDFLSGVYEGLK